MHIVQDRSGWRSMGEAVDLSGVIMMPSVPMVNHLRFNGWLVFALATLTLPHTHHPSSCPPLSLELLFKK